MARKNQKCLKDNPLWGLSSSSIFSTMLLIQLLLLLQPTAINSFAPIRPNSLTSAFIQNLASTQTKTISSPVLATQNIETKRDVKLFLFKKIFRRNSNDQNDDGDEDDGKDDEMNTKNKLKTTTTTTTTTTTSTTTSTTRKNAIFFAREREEEVEVKVEPAQPPTKKLTPIEQAKMLRAQAERARLEAEKMDVMLTLEKIEKLELQLEKSKKATSSDGEEEDSRKKKKEKTSQEDLIKQIESLKRKLNGEDITATAATTTNDEQKVERDVEPKVDNSNGGANVDSVVLSVINEAKNVSESSPSSSEVKTEPSLTKDEIETLIQKFDNAPNFMKELVVSAAGMSMDNLNTTELILKMEKDNIVYSDSNGAEQQKMPDFTQEQIDEVVEAVKMVPQFVKNLYGDEIKNNDTAIALLMLEEEWKDGKIMEMPEITQEMIDLKLEESEWVPKFLRGENDTELAIELIKLDFKNNPKKFRADYLGEKKGVANGSDDTQKSIEDSSPKEGFFSSNLFGDQSKQQDEKSPNDNMVESLFPPTTRRDGEEPSEEDVNAACVEIFAKDNIWSPSGKPEKVPGGYIIRGVTKYETGKELMETIYKKLESSNLVDKISVFYVFDPTTVTEEQMEGGERPPVLFVTGAKVVRDPAPIQRSIISSLALGTIWYNSLLPYLLNDKYMKLADEQLALADASMPTNMDFLNDLSFPLFVSIIGIQFAHEVAHLVAAKMNGLQTSFPTLVPSLDAGLTGAITSLEAPPKDKQSLFDFAIAGPLTGLGVSVVLMYIGMFLSSSMDAAAFSDLPALPLSLLRQSSLAGGIIDSISPGLLTVPDAALGTKALADINISLHPLTIAGYLGLMTNAINLLPVGSKYQ